MNLTDPLNVSWFDEIIFFLKDGHVVHIPVADAGPIFPQQAERLLATIRDRSAAGKIYIHCWQGRGRTFTALSYILQRIHQLTFEEAFDVIVAAKDSLYNAPKPVQFKWLRTGEISEEDMIAFEPICKTPENHTVWEEKRKRQ